MKHEISVLNKFTKDKLEADRELILKVAGERKTKVVFDQLDEVISLEKEFVEANVKKLTLDASEESLDAEEEAIVKVAYEILKISYGALATLNKEALDIYFKGLTPSSTKKKPELVLKGLKRGMNVINNPEHEQIDNFRAKYEDSIEKLDKFLTKKAEYDSSVEAVKEVKAEKDNSWNREYKVLKLYVKAAFVDSEYDYRVYFKDLLKKRGSSHSNKDETNSNQPEIQPEIVPTPLEDSNPTE